MELRKVEQELDALSSEWKALRRKRPQFDVSAKNDAHDVSGDGDTLCARMPSWKELKTKVKDEEIFPPDEDEDEEVGDNVNMANGSADANNTDNSTADATKNNNDNAADADTAGYSEFGMCLAPSATTEESVENSKADTSGSSAKKNGGNIWERYAAKSAAKPKDSEPAKIEKETAQVAAEEDDEKDVEIEDAPAKDVLAQLESLHERFVALAPKIDKFLVKLNDRDPVTKKPRYGEKTMFRVKNSVRIYKALEQGVNDIGQEPGLVSYLRSQLQRHDEQRNAQIQAQQSQQQLEAERLAKEKLLAEECANQQRLLEEQQKKDEERELARRAEEARLRRIEEEQAALEAEKRADEELLALVPNLGAEGVREQIGCMREALKDDRAAFDVAIGSIYTLFEQIVRKPEEINFRRVRRDHPKFMEDIGRHVGGREILIAAGFKLEKLDGVPCFFSKEPHIESDMDGWSNWFDTLKKTLEVVEEEMLK